VRTVVHHPQGYGLGNAGQTASRTGTPIRAGESNYTEIGAETGLLGALLWIAWNLSVFAGLVVRRAAAIAAVFAAILVLAVQTDVVGDPWVGYCIWTLAGIGLAEVALAVNGDRPASRHRARAPEGERPRARDRVLP
jgi:O-antigen ligase